MAAVRGALRGPAGSLSRCRTPSLAASSTAAAGGGFAPLPVTEDGSGPETLFFVHGWPDDEHLWDAQVEHFKSRFRCLRVTMPHFAGRAVARELGHRPAGYDFWENGEIVAATIRAASPDRPVVLVIHDWGCLWGFFAQLRHPELVKAIVAMDVGPLSSCPAGIGSLPAVLLAGLSYQIPLFFCNCLARFTAGTLLESSGRWIADGVVRTEAGIFLRGIASDADLRSDRITADACYPYAYFQTNWGVKEAPTAGVGPEPSCPCLFLYGKRKPAMFHTRRWEQELADREDCQVSPVNSGHWIQLEKPQEVNRIMQDWLEVALQRLAEGAGASSRPRSRL